jgi:hypothetical protein
MAEIPFTDGARREVTRIPTAGGTSGTAASRSTGWVRGVGPEFRDMPWPGLYPPDPDLYDEVDAGNFRQGTPEFGQAERAAEAAYRRAVAEEW